MSEFVRVIAFRVDEPSLNRIEDRSAHAKASERNSRSQSLVSGEPQPRLVHYHHVT